MKNLYYSIWVDAILRIKENPLRKEDWKWMSIEAIKEDMQIHPDIYTVWFKIIFDEFYHYLEEHKL